MPNLTLDFVVFGMILFFFHKFCYTEAGYTILMIPQKLSPSAKYIFGYLVSQLNANNKSRSSDALRFLIGFFSVIFSPQGLFLFYFLCELFLTVAKNLQCRWIKTHEYDPSSLAAKQRLRLLLVTLREAVQFSSA